MNPLLLKAIPYLLAIGIVGGSLYGAYHHGVTVTTSKYEAAIEKQTAEYAQESAKIESDARADEQQKAASLHAIDQQSITDKQNEINSRDTTIAGLQSGSLQLRKRFTCASDNDKRVSAVAGTASVNNAASGTGLQQADAEFLVRLASDADQVVTQLRSCQAVINADRGLK